MDCVGFHVMRGNLAVEATMESKPILRVFFQILLALVTLAALPVEAGAARSVSQSRESAAPTPEDLAYQKLVDATSAVVGVKVKALANARSNETLGDERLGSGVLIG